MKILLVILSLICCQILAAQDAAEMQIIQMNQKIYKGLLDDQDTPNYLFPINLSDSFFTATKGTQFESLANQSMAWYFSYVGEYKQAIKFYSRDLDTKSLSTSNFEDLSKYKAQSAKEVIVSEAAHYDFILINEAHHKPQHRIFTHSLLASLKDQGYNTFAVETLGKKAFSINETKIIDENLGGLALEPHYADVIRQALKLGYTILPYDYETDFEFEKRDSLGAFRLVQYKRDHPAAKVLVHCGYEHISENTKALAYWVKKFSGEDVLTINQTAFTEEYKPELESPYYQMGVNYHKLSHPFVLSKKKVFFREDEASDLFVFHPRTTYTLQRPDWQLHYKLPQAYIEVPTEYLKSSDKLSLFQAFYSDEYAKGLPVDQFIVQPSDKEPKGFILAPGCYKIKSEDVDRNTIWEADLLVEKEGNFSFSEAKK